MSSRDVLEPAPNESWEPIVISSGIFVHNLFNTESVKKLNYVKL